MRGPTSRAVAIGLVFTLVFTAPFISFGVLSLTDYVRGQLNGAVYHADFLNYYSAGEMLLEQPGNLYRPDAERAFQRQLAGGADVYDAFWSLPQLALLFAPLALLPYGVAYLVWCVVNLSLLALSAHLLAPRIAGRSAGWLWTLLALCYLPVVHALTDGQTPFVLLCGFCGFVWLMEGGHPAAPTALLGWAWKPQLMLAPLLALVLGRRWRSAVGLVLVQTAASGAVVVWAGVDSLQRYLEIARIASEQTAQRVAPPGQTLLGLAQSLIGVGPAAVALGVVTASGVALVIGWMWWGGLRSDARRDLQLAAIPIAALLTATRAGTYELTLWLASAWLLVRYTHAVPGHRQVALGLVFVLWWAGDLATLAEPTTGFEWGPPAGLAALGVIAWWMRAEPVELRSVEDV
jgi:hypothetical protein